MAESIPSPLVRVPTGIAGLDQVLEGGLFSGGAYIVMGLPGSGKTTLGNQAAFHHVAHGGKALYVTLLTEQHARMLQHLQSFRFLDQTAIGQGLTYVSAFRTLEAEGLKGIMNLLTHEVRELRTTLLIIDGLVTAESAASSELEVKKFVQEVQSLMTLTGSSALLLTNLSGRTSYPTHTMVDGIIELRDEILGARAVRTLSVSKFRGGDQRRGRHVFEITNDGLVVHPRIESLPPPAPPRIPSGPLLRTGIDQLDVMLHGGLAPASSTLVLGPPGSGKTLLGLHFLLAGAEEGEPGLHFGFFENEQELIDAGRATGIDVTPHIERGLIAVRVVLSAEAGVDALAEQLLDEVRRRKVRRLFVDGLGGFRADAIDPDRITPMFTALLARLRALGVATLISDDVSEVLSPEIVPPTPHVASRVQNIILLRYVELRSQLHRLISIVKRRGGGYDRALREFVIDDGGITVADTFASAEAILSGLAHPLPNGKKPKPRAKPRAKPRRGKRP